MHCSTEIVYTSMSIINVVHMSCCNIIAVERLRHVSSTGRFRIRHGPEKKSYATCRLLLTIYIFYINSQREKIDNDLIFVHEKNNN